MKKNLYDLDELVLQCRDKNARSYIKEAVECYNAGAFRSSIVATWIAVAYDLLEKFRELSLTGDKEAERQVEQFEKARESGDVNSALKIERELLLLAKDKFELISLVEHTDLSRLQADRHRCAHPSMISTEKSYDPSAELARYHISNAVESLLKHQPVQGKSALERLVKEVDSEYFPNSTKDAKSHFSHGPLSRPRESLVRNFVIVLLKKMIFNDLDYNEMRRYGAALNAVREMHRVVTENTLKEKVSELLRTLNDTSLNRSTKFLRQVNDTWHLIEKDIQEKISRYVKNMPSRDLGRITDLLKVEELKDLVAERVNKLSRDEAFVELLFESHALINERRVELYIKSNNYDYANDVAEDLKFYTAYFSKNQIEKLLKGVSENDQVRNSYEINTVISSIRKNERITDEDINDLLTQYNLEEYIP